MHSLSNDGDEDDLRPLEEAGDEQAADAHGEATVEEDGGRMATLLASPRGAAKLDALTRLHGRIGVGRRAHEQEYDGDNAAAPIDIESNGHVLRNCFRSEGPGAIHGAMRSRMVLSLIHI